MDIGNIDEMDFQKFKEVLKFLVTQEKIREEEIAALKEMILGVDGYCKEYVDGENFAKFKEAYSKRLEPYEAMLKASEGEDFDVMKNAYDTYKTLGDEVSQDDYINKVEESAKKMMADIKASLGLPEDTPLEIKDDGQGNQQVTADMDKDGTAETEVGQKEEAIDQKSIDEAVAEYNPRR